MPIFYTQVQERSTTGWRGCHRRILCPLEVAMRLPELLIPLLALGALMVRFVVDVAAVLVALVIWDRWFKRK